MPGIWNPIIYRGTTFNPVLNYSSPDFTIKTITGVTKSARAHVTATAHGLTVKSKVFIASVLGMKQINNSRDLSRVDKAYTATVIDANTVSLDIDSSEFSAYVSGGELVFHTPVNLTGYTAALTIRSSFDSSVVLLSLTTANGGITLGGTAGTIAILISSAATAAITWDTAVFDLRITSAGLITSAPLLTGRITVSDE